MEVRVEILNELGKDGGRDGASSEYGCRFVSVMIFHCGHVRDGVGGDDGRHGETVVVRRVRCWLKGVWKG